MQKIGRLRPGVGLATALVWALAAGSALYWGLHAGQTTPASLPPPAGDAGPAVDARAVAHALGLPQAEAGAQSPIASRVHLSGVLTHGAGGAALLAVDGKPPKPYRVGEPVADGWVVHAVSPHAVELADGPQRTSLDMPPLDQRSSAGDAVAPASQGGVTPNAPMPQPMGAPAFAPAPITAPRMPPRQ